MKKLISAVVISAAISTPALAANAGTGYIAADYGQWSMSNAGLLPNPGVLTLSGGYHFTPNIGIEAGYAIVGDSTVSDPFGSITYSQSAVKVAAVGTFPVNPQIDVFGKLGLISVSGSLSGTGFYAGTSGSASTSSVMYGIGGQFNINQNVGIRVQYESLGKTKASSAATGADVTSFSAGVVYTF